jgi:hypothetical protein
VQLIPPMLCDENALSRRINRESFCIAYPGRESLGWRECLIGLVRVLASNAAAGQDVVKRDLLGRSERTNLLLLFI